MCNTKIHFTHISINVYEIICLLINVYIFSILNRVLEPHIIMEWTFSNGKCQIFELSLPKFHQLRHAIATILVDMQKVEKQCASKNILCS